jgi:hypothetical protein
VGGAARRLEQLQQEQEQEQQQQAGRQERLCSQPCRAPSACAIAPMPPLEPSGEGASRGMSISSTTTARSCEGEEGDPLQLECRIEYQHVGIRQL